MEWTILAAYTGLAARDFLDRMERWYRKTWFALAGLVILLAFLGIMFNKSDALRLVNFLLALGCFAGWAFLALYPRAALSVFGLGFLGKASAGCLNYLEIGGRKVPYLRVPVHSAVDQGLHYLKNWLNVTSHLGLVFALYFLIMGTFRAAEPKLVIPTLIALLALPVWSVAFPRKHHEKPGFNWYKGITHAIILVILGLTMWNTFHFVRHRDKASTEVTAEYVSCRDERMADRIRGKKAPKDCKALKADQNAALHQVADTHADNAPQGVVTGAAAALWKTGFVPYSKKVERTVTGFDPIQVCGLRTGVRTFSVTGPIQVLIDGAYYDLETYVRVNGFEPGQQFRVLPTDGGCATLSFAFTKKMHGREITPQLVHLTVR